MASVSFELLAMSGELKRQKLTARSFLVAIDRKTTIIARKKNAHLYLMHANSLQFQFS
jgi:hypothetical protein